MDALHRAKRIATTLAIACGTCFAAYGVSGHADQTTEDWIHSFGVTTGDGRSPSASGLVVALDGNYYGVTIAGGANDNGTIYRITPAGEESIIYSFSGGADGCAPNQSLFLDRDGLLYGTTSRCGAHGAGTVFQVSIAGVMHTVYAFDSGSDGDGPSSPLIRGSDGKLYGTTQLGGKFNSGTVFNVAPDGTFAVLHAFGDSPTDGVFPNGGLVQVNGGSYYGSTIADHASGGGTIFRVTASGQYSTFYRFPTNPEGPDGIMPMGLAAGPDDTLYGVTKAGGSFGLGTIFRVGSRGRVSTLHSFNANYYSALGGYLEGYSPGSAPLLGSDGNLYGTTQAGSTLYRLTPDGAYVTLYAFARTDGEPTFPIAPLTLGIDGRLYGTSSYGGSANQGAAFKVSPAQAPVTVVLRSQSTSITTQGRVVLRWTTSNASSCVASSSDGSWSGKLTKTAGLRVAPAPTAPGSYWYSIGCIDSQDATTSTSTVTIAVTAG